MSELDLLRRLGDQIAPPSFDALRETARRRNRRTATFATVVAAAAVAAVIGIVQQELVDHRSETPPTPQPVDTSRPLTYADGATVHYGDQSVTMPSPVAELDLTDDGVAVRTEDGQILFTDGSEPEQIGVLGSPARSFDPNAIAPSADVAFGTVSGFMVSPTTGSLVGWFEFTQPRQPELVVYDTTSGEETTRQPIQLDAGSSALLADVTDQVAYVYIDPVLFDDPAAVGRVDLTTGEQVRLTPAEYDAESVTPPLGTPQTLLVSHQEGGGRPYEVDDGIHMQLGMHGGHVEPLGEQPLEVLDAGTRTPLTALAWPAGYKLPKDYPGWVTQWIDDDAFVIGYRTPTSTDLLECHMSTSACEVAAHTDGVAVLPETGVLPDL